MKKNKGFTLIELMVVLALAAIISAIVVPGAYRWLGDFRFSAGLRAFISGADTVRLHALEGNNVLDIVAINSSVGSTSFSVTANFTTVQAASPTEDDVPISDGDYVTVTGLADPDYFNGNTFRITGDPSWTDTNVIQPDAVKFPDTWQMQSIQFTCESCREDDPDNPLTNCITWNPSGGGSGIISTTARGLVAACLKFVADDDMPVSYRTVRKGASVECRYDTDLFQVDMVAVKKSADLTSEDKIPLPGDAIAFNATGGTRDRAHYRIRISRKRKGSIEGQGQVILNVWPTGKIKSGGCWDEPCS